MKKTFSLILALALCSSLCACGSGSVEDTKPEITTPQNTTSETTPQETTKPESIAHEVELYLDEVAIVGDYEFRITNVQFADSYKMNNTVHRAEGKNDFIRIDFTVKNISKTIKTVFPSDCMVVDYNDGYIFEPEYSDCFITSGTSSGVNGCADMEPLSNAARCSVFVSVPSEVQTSENPLCIKIALSNGDGTAEAVFNMRPMNQIQQEAYYQKITGLLESACEKKSVSSAYLAVLLLEDLGDYKDAADLNEKAYTYWYALSFSTTDDEQVAFFNERLDTFPMLTGEEISSLFVGEWEYSKISDPITIDSAGNMTNTLISDYSCRVESNTWIVNNGSRDFVYEVRYITEDIYMLIENGNLACTMIRK